VLEPQSTALFLLLLVVFAALVAWMALARQPAFRVFAACLAFIPAMLFGVAAVNKYYDYYQTWGAMAADIGGQGTNQVAMAPTVDSASARQISAILGRQVNLKAAADHGQTIRMTVPGKLSHLSRTAYVYLPPQYFRAGYSRFRFPVIELLPGFPGTPLDWIDVMGFTSAYASLLADGVVKPAVLVMPDTNGGNRISLQCLNVRHGPQDATYLAVDLPSYLPTVLRVQPAGPAWGVAGYSEGGYCAANLALVYRLHWGAAGILSGYFTPGKDQLGSPPRLVNPFGHDKRALHQNTPRLRIAALPVSDSIPQFWLGVGSRDVLGLRDAHNFQRLLVARQPAARLDIVPGGGHTMATWRALTPALLQWMTPLLTEAAEHPSQFHQLGKTRVAHTRGNHKASVRAAARRSVRSKATPPA
jgi:enterochelin esterase-like enzyme